MKQLRYVISQKVLHARDNSLTEWVEVGFKFRLWQDARLKLTELSAKYPYHTYDIWDATEKCWCGFE